LIAVTAAAPHARRLTRFADIRKEIAARHDEAVEAASRIGSRCRRSPPKA
jgi:hypothetical protein